MKRFIFLSLYFLLCLLVINGQEKKHKKFIHSWHIDELFATADSVPMDTLRYNYQYDNIIDRFSIANSYNANYGSPIESKIYMKRPERSDFLFEYAYKPYVRDISNALFYDSSFPYTNLTYLTSRPSERSEDHFKFMYTANSSKKMNIGANTDYIYARGRYENQAAQRFAGNIFARYAGKHYSSYAFIGMNRHSHYDNGGLTNPNLLINPDVEVQHKDMPTFIQSYAVFKKNVFYYNQNYSIGFNREVKPKNDSTKKDSITYEYVPVTKFGHRIKFEEMQKRYFEPSLIRNFYENTYDTIHKFTNDTAAVRTLTNTFSVNLAEEFNKWARFGLTAYAENEIHQFNYMPDSVLMKETFSNTRVGGMISKYRGDNFRFSVLGDIYLQGYKLGDFKVQGKAELNFKVWKEPVHLSAQAFIKNQAASYFLQTYYSNHFRWKNDFSKTFTTHISGLFELPKRGTKINVGVENLTNTIYFNEKGLPTQHDGNVQIISLDVRQDFSFFRFRLENNVVYQLSSNQSVVPLPMLSLFHNFYYHDKWFKDLYPQLGVSVRYHTSYYAPSYVPATSQFYNQRAVKIGNYPVLDVYANFHLKRARFFIKYTNLGAFFVKGWAMLMPNYPINPPMLKAGLSWNFYN